MELITALIFAAVFIAIIAALVGVYLWLLSVNPPGRSGLELTLRSNPTHVCASTSCVFGIEWEATAQRGGVDTVELSLTAPSGRVTPLSSQASGRLDIATNGTNTPFAETGTYRLTLTATNGDNTETTTNIVEYYAERDIIIHDAWSTNSTGSVLSEGDSIVNHSTILAQNPNTDPVVELGRGLPANLTVCAKGMVLTGVTLASGTLVDGAVLPVQVVVRRPGGQIIDSQILEHLDTLNLPLPLVDDEGIEILSRMGRIDGKPIPGDQVELHLHMRCV